MNYLSLLEHILDCLTDRKHESELAEYILRGEFAVRKRAKYQDVGKL